MTNAERQRRYRDKKRGGPPVGRWAGHGQTISQIAASPALRIARTRFIMLEWLTRHCPHLKPDIWAGRIKTTPTYRRLKEEYDRAVIVAVCEAGEQGVPLEDISVYWEDGRFRHSFCSGQ